MGYVEMMEKRHFPGNEDASFLQWQAGRLLIHERRAPKNAITVLHFYMSLLVFCVIYATIITEDEFPGLRSEFSPQFSTAFFFPRQLTRMS